MAEIEKDSNMKQSNFITFISLYTYFPLMENSIIYNSINK